MEINWFTFVAQIINFLILVFLLQRFLYEPIIKVINQRKNKIKGQLLEAEDQFIKAQEQEQKYLNLTEELEKKRQEFLNQAKEEAHIEKTKLLQLVKTEIEESQKRWQIAIKQEQERFLLGLKHRAGEELFNMIRKALNDLANRELESQIIDVFLENLLSIDEQKKVNIIKNLQNNQEFIMIQTSFEIREDKQQEIIKKMQETFNNETEIRFEKYPDLLCGINLIIGGEELSWSLESYLKNLEENLKISLEM